MSRAFVKELEDAPEIWVEARGEPRAITRAGYEALVELFAKEEDATRKAAFGRLLDNVFVPDPPERRDRVGFGAHVTVRGVAAKDRLFEIVGEDEIDPEHGRIGESSPLALALMGKAVGEKAIWERPAGTRELEVVEIDYD
jgi:transcription elongation GreA/GreB family factor